MGDSLIAQFMATVEKMGEIRRPIETKWVAELMGNCQLDNEVASLVAHGGVGECAKKGGLPNKTYEKHKVILVVSTNGDTPKIDDL
jgi:hypothetical protein